MKQNDDTDLYYFLTVFTRCCFDLKKSVLKTFNFKPFNDRSDYKYLPQLSE